MAVRTTGPMVELAAFLGNDGLAASYARQGVKAARMLGWYLYSVDVPPEAHENARMED